MTIISGYPKRTRHGRTFEEDDKSVKTYEETWIVLTSTPTDGQTVVLNAAGLPVRGQPYSDDGNAKCISRSGRLSGDDDGTGTLWEVVCRYTTRLDLADISQTQNPLARPVRWSMKWGGVQQVPAVLDNGIAKGKRMPVVNLAGDQYNPPPTINVPIITFSARRNEAAIPFPTMVAYRAATNSDTWGIFPLRTVIVSGISTGEIQFENGTYFYEVTYDFEFNPDKYDINLLEIGMNGLKYDASSNLVKVPFGGDQPKLLLVGNPTKAPGNIPVTYTDNPDLAAYTADSRARGEGWRVRPEVPFSGLGLTLP